MHELAKKRGKISQWKSGVMVVRKILKCREYVSETNGGGGISGKQGNERTYEPANSVAE